LILFVLSLFVLAIVWSIDDVSYFAGHYRTDPPNTTNGDKIWQFKSGEGCFVPTNGTISLSMHSDAAIDPINDSIFWVYTPFAFGTSARCQDNDWATGVAAVQFVGGE
jgi:hypothetical protein